MTFSDCLTIEDSLAGASEVDERDEVLAAFGSGDHLEDSGESLD